MSEETNNKNQGIRRRALNNFANAALSATNRPDRLDCGETNNETPPSTQPVDGVLMDPVLDEQDNVVDIKPSGSANENSPDPESNQRRKWAASQRTTSQQYLKTQGEGGRRTSP